MSATISHEDWLAELLSIQASAPVDAPGVTTGELAIRMGCTEETARRKIKRWVVGGHLEHAGFRTILRMNGTPFPVPVYRVVAKS